METIEISEDGFKNCTKSDGEVKIDGEVSVGNNEGTRKCQQG